MNMEHAFALLIERMDQLERIVSRQAGRINNILREGVVKSVDFQKGLAVVEAHGIETKPLPWFEQAGDVNEWTPLSVGQRVMLVSPGGDLGRAVIMRGGFTDDVPQPHDQGAEKRTQIGDCTITQTGTSFEISVGDVTFTFDANGYRQTGGKMKHNDRNVGDDHVHGGVVPGAATTDVPAN